MNSHGDPPGEAEILAARGPKNAVDPLVPWASFAEAERTAEGSIAGVATIFLTGRECPLRCLMCDLWKNTLDGPTPSGAIPAQIEHALARLPAAGPTGPRHVKLYNSGNFFDPLAVPRSDYGPIACRLGPFAKVIVENHPRFCTADCLRFRDLIAGRLEVALGLETIHPQALAALNKRMTVGDFGRAAAFLTEAGIAVRAFVLLRPPLLSEHEGIEWALASIEHAFAAGVSCCSVIPTRAGNGIMDRLQREGRFSPPRLASLERVLASGIRLGRGRVFVDLWDAERLAACPHCRGARIERLRRMNLSQQVLPPIACDSAGCQCEGRA